MEWVHGEGEGVWSVVLSEVYGVWSMVGMRARVSVGVNAERE